jgi:hypothetical protein
MRHRSMALAAAPSGALLAIQSAADDLHADRNNPTASADGSPHVLLGGQTSSPVSTTLDI